MSTHNICSHWEKGKICDFCLKKKSKLSVAKDKHGKKERYSRKIWYVLKLCFLMCDLFSTYFTTEWKKGSVPVTLQDEDSSSTKLDGWKKINTLQHYRVFDGAEMALVRRYQAIKSPNGSLDTSVVSVTSSASMLRMESEGGTKFYHLVCEIYGFRTFYYSLG